MLETVDVLLFLLYVYTLWVVTKTDVINSNMHRSEQNLVTSKDISLCSGTGVFKTYESFMILRAIVGNTKPKLF